MFAVIGLPYWLPLALWTGLVAQFVPNVGTYISIALPVVVGFTSGDHMLGVYVLIWGIACQQVENVTIEPRISARAVDLHTAVSFGAALLGAQRRPGLGRQGRRRDPVCRAAGCGCARGPRRYGPPRDARDP